MFTSNFSVAISDIVNAIKKNDITITLGWQDVATRYRRSRIGAFWLTINMLVLISVLGIVFGSVFRASVEDFIPSLSVGIVVWGLMSGTLNEGCESFTSVRDTVLQVKVPLSIHVFRVIVRNIFIFGHNLLILPLVFIFFLRPISFEAIYSILGLVLLLINLTWMILFLSVICSRFRDMALIIQNFMQIMFYMTPIIWTSDMLPERYGQDILNLNPFYHLLTVVRAPLLGDPLTMSNWVFPVFFAIFGWFFSLAFFNYFYKRIPYWL